METEKTAEKKQRKKKVTTSSKQTPVCPRHNIELITTRNPHGPGWLQFCPHDNCTHPAQIIQRRVSAQLRMPLDGVRAEQLLKDEKEAPIQARTIQMFEVRGYEVLETSEHRKRIQCPIRYNAAGLAVAGCGQWFMPDGGRGVDKGIPDLYVRHMVKYPPFVWIGLEAKGSTTRLSDAQQRLAAMHGIAVFRSHEDAWYAVEYVEKILKPVFDIYKQYQQWLPNNLPLSSR